MLTFSRSLGRFPTRARAGASPSPRLACTLTLLPAFLACAQPLRGQVIQGALLDDQTGERIPAGTLTLLAGDSVPLAETQTNQRGAFVLHAASPGAYRLRAERPGYSTAISSALELMAGDTLRVQFRLSRHAVVLDPIVVTPRRGGRLADYYDRLERRPWASIVTREEIERRNAYRATELLRDVPGVQLAPLRGSAGSAVVFRGRCSPMIFVDGIHIPINGRYGPTIDDLVHPSNLEGIEVYRNSLEAPSQYGMIGSCGAILLWTRRDG